MDVARFRWLNRGVPRRARPVVARAALGAAFAVVLLGMVELGLRIAGVRPAYRAEELGQWRTQGSQSHRLLQGPKDGHGFYLSTNVDGLRTMLPRARTSGVRRIALMGDSTVFGWGVDDGGTIGDGVQAVLGPASVEVLNAGQPGYSTTMVAWLFKEVVAAYQPDLVIVFIPMHDANRVLVSDAELLGGGATTSARVRVLLARESRIYEALRGLLFDSTEKAWLLPDQSGGEPRVPRVSDMERDHALDGMAAAAAGWGGSVGMGFLPFKGDIEDGAGMQRPALEWARARAIRTGEPLIDVRACCAGQTGLVLADDPGHLTREGNLAAGAAIAAQLPR